MKIVWWVARYLFTIVAIYLIGFVLTLEMGNIVWGELGILLALGYAVVAPIRVLWRRRSHRGGE